MTQEHVDEILQVSHRCTQATLLAFGIASVPHTGSGCLTTLIENGWQVKELHSFRGDKLRQVKSLLEKSGRENYLINTPGHAMAFVDGRLIDTERKGFDGRVIEHIWRVTK